MDQVRLCFVTGPLDCIPPSPAGTNTPIKCRVRIPKQHGFVSDRKGTVRAMDHLRVEEVEHGVDAEGVCDEHGDSNEEREVPGEGTGGQ